jgi:hypothetical protein
MDSAHVSLLRRSTAVFVATGYLALAAVPQIGAAILIVPALALAFARTGEYLDANHKVYGVLSRGVTVAYFCFLPLSWAKLDLLPTVVILVIYIQCYTLVHVKTVRNYYHLFLMSLFLLLAACVLSPDPIIGLIMLIFLASAVWANMALRIVVEESACSQLPEVELISLDNMLHHAYREGPPNTSSSMPLAATSLSLAAITITTLWFFLTPRIEAGVLGRNQVETQVTGVSETVDLSEGGAITEDQTPVMLAQFPEEAEGQIANPDWLYWRVTTHNSYGDNRWENRQIRLLDPGIRNLVSTQRGESGDTSRVERFMRPGARMVHQVIYMDDVPRTGVPVLDLVQRVRVDENTKGVELIWGRENDFTVRLNKVGTRRLNYEAWSEVGEPSPEELRQIPFDYASVEPADLDTLTLSPLSDASIDLATSLVADQPTLYDAVAAIEAFLSGPSFLYTLDNTDTSAESVIDEFILTTRRGHCEKFATAMALMVRSQGIPARVVSGYRGGEWNESDQSYTIRANMAHLWVEVWFPTAGWMRFDPSPRANDEPLSQFGQMARLASRVMLKSKMFWFREVVGFDRAAQVDRLRDFSLGIIQGLRGQSEESNTPPVTGNFGRLGMITPLIVLALTFCGVAYALYRVRWVPVPRNRALSREQVRVVRLYLLLRRRLQKFGVTCAGRTAEELREELHAPRWGSPESALEVIELYNTVRFGCRTTAGTDFARLRKAVLGLRPRET